MDPRTRRELTRWGAPAAFLAAVTIAVLLVKSGLNDGGASTTTVVQPTTATTTTQPTTTRIVLTTTAASTVTTTPGAEYYVIESGDTLGEIAEKYDTTVEELLTLNPDVDPAALHPGDRLRVG